MRTEPLTHLRPARHVRATITDHGGMVLDLRGRGRWHALSPVACLWWQYLGAGLTVAETADLVAARYSVARERTRSDGDELVRDLHERGLLVASRRPRKERPL
ncbi:hypothetical protein GCM10028784_25770 [Myceligenerans cantabricum]